MIHSHIDKNYLEMYILLKNRYKPIMYQGHRGLLYSINRNTSIICSFTTKDSYFNINLLPPVFDLEETNAADKRNFVKFNVVVHKTGFKFQSNNKINNKTFINQLTTFHFYYNLSKTEHIPV